MGGTLSLNSCCSSQFGPTTLPILQAVRDFLEFEELSCNPLTDRNFGYFVSLVSLLHGRMETSSMKYNVHPPWGWGLPRKWWFTPLLANIPKYPVDSIKVSNAAIASCPQMCFIRVKVFNWLNMLVTPPY